MADVFISYSSEDRSRISLLAERLEQEGFSVWWDREIPVGHDFITFISTQLDEAACVIVVWSAASVASPYVRSEAEAARVRGVLVPALIEAVPIPVPFNLLQGARLADWDGDPSDSQWQKLVMAVRYRVPVESREMAKEAPVEESVADSKELPADLPAGAGGLPLGPGIALLLEDAADARRKTHPYLGLHHWLVALLDRHPGLVARMEPSLDCRALSREFDRKMSEEEDYGEAISAEEVIERAGRRARDREAERVWESDVAAVILAAAGLSDG
ncbi:MAG: toll/interleukin-1 receptor domain-containing protein [Actinobacteria bacterium]|nr:toll/interleukin-1 receptor domain-containing protein [Actinomycetota bacterium]